MIELYHIPIFAFSKSEFFKRVAKTESLLRLRFDTISEESMQYVLQHETFPQRATHLNHIVGFITVSFAADDLFFDVHLPVGMKKYIWTSRQKWHMQNVFANGTHFRLETCPDNDTIRNKVEGMVSHIIKEIVPKRFYIDRKQFERMNHTIDYIALIDMARKELEASTNG